MDAGRSHPLFKPAVFGFLHLDARFFSPQVDDIKYALSGVTRGSTGTDGGLWTSEDLLLATDTPPPFSEDLYPPSAPSSPVLSPVDQALDRLNRPASSEQNSQRDSPPMDACDLRY